MPITKGKSWIRTFTGKPFAPLEPDPELIDIEDIAHALSHQCRFSGHTKYFYSVAQHSVNVARIVTPGYEKHALMHDASEAYLQDMPTPIKAVMPQYQEAEEVLQTLIERKFGINMSTLAKTCVKEADMRMLATEARDLMGNPQDWENLRNFQTCPWKVEPWSSAYAKERFLERYKELWLN